MPNFAFEYMDGGAGAVDLGVRRNWTSLDNVELAPRYGKVVQPPSCEATLFGRPYNAPIGISPIGGPGTAFPGAETYLAKAAQKLKVPYTLGLLSGITVEEAAQIAPDVLWFQLYRFSRNDHQIGLDLTRLKLQVFALSAAIAGLGGALLGPKGFRGREQARRDAHAGLRPAGPAPLVGGEANRHADARDQQDRHQPGCGRQEETDRKSAHSGGGDPGPLSPNHRSDLGF